MNIPQPPQVPRITYRSILLSILQVLNLEKGMGYTLKSLVLRPAAAIEEFLFFDRTRLTKPFQLVVLLVAIATFLTLKFIPETKVLTEQLVADPSWQAMPASVQDMMLWLTLNLRQYFNLIYVSGLPVISLATYWIFRRAKLNYAEHLVINTYIFCIQALIYIIFAGLMFRYSWIGGIQGLLALGYMVYAHWKIFRNPFWPSLLKSIAVYFLAQLLVVLILVLIGGLWFLFR